MYSEDPYLENLLINNPRHLNTIISSNNQNNTNNIKNFDDDSSFIQKTYLILLSILGLKILSMSIYSK